MSDLLFGKTLNWTSWDPTNILTAMLQTLIMDWSKPESVKVRLLRVVELSDYEEQLTPQATGLAVWALWDDEQVEHICTSLAAVRDRDNSAVRVCFVVPELAQHMGLLTEAGGQIVVSQMHSLSTILPKILPRCPLAQHGYHPLTGGLVDRLPWPDA